VKKGLQRAGITIDGVKRNEGSSGKGTKGSRRRAGYENGLIPGCIICNNKKGFIKDTDGVERGKRS